MAHPWDLPRPAHLVLFLADARRRGLPFDRAWADGVWIVCHAARDRDWWLGVFAEQREAWRRAYEGEAPTRPEAALGEVRPEHLGELVVDLAEDVSARPCAVCEGPIHRSDPRARYCSVKCRRAAQYQQRRISRAVEDARSSPSRVLHPARDGDVIDHTALEEAA